MLPITLLLVGIVAAALGGELFVRGTVGLASRLRIPPGIIGATVAALATSSPELSVGLTSAAQGIPEVALGDALGSNVVNVGLVLGLVLLAAGARPRRADLDRDLPIALIAPLATLGLAADGTVSRLDACILLASFAAWLWVTLRQAARERAAAPEVLAGPRPRHVVRDVLLGTLLLITAGQLLVAAATDLAEALGWDGFTVGAVLVALGTSTPELAAALTARLRGHDEVGVGTVLGSNILNNLMIVGTAGTIRPISARPDEIGVAVVAGVVALLLVVPGHTTALGRGRGAALLAVYLGYLIALAARA